MNRLALTLESLTVESFPTSPVLMVRAPRTLNIECCNSCGGGKCPPPITNTIDC